MPPNYLCDDNEDTLIEIPQHLEYYTLTFNDINKGPDSAARNYVRVYQTLMNASPTQPVWVRFNFETYTEEIKELMKIDN